jgi:hypothetical protein
MSNESVGPPPALGGLAVAGELLWEKKIPVIQYSTEIPEGWRSTR